MNKTIQNSLERMLKLEEGSLIHCFLTSAVDESQGYFSFYVDKAGEILYAGHSTPSEEIVNNCNKGAFSIIHKESSHKITGYSVQNITNLIRKNIEGFVEEFNKHYSEKFDKKQGE